MMPGWLDLTVTGALAGAGIIGLLWLGWRWATSSPPRCPQCNAPKGKIHKPKCDYLVQQSGG